MANSGRLDSLLQTAKCIGDPITISSTTSGIYPIRLCWGKVCNDETRTVAKCNFTDVLWCEPYFLPLVSGTPNQEDNVDNMRTRFVFSKVGSDH